MRNKNSNLRVLSTAYAAGKLTKDQYRALRSKQLSAIEFGKPLPPLPPGLATVEVPDNVSIRSKRSSRGSGGLNPAVLVVLLVLILGAFGGTAFFILKNAQPQEVTLESLAEKIESSAETSDMNQFIAMWNALSRQEQKQAKNTAWAAALRSASSKSIKSIEKAKSFGGISNEVSTRLRGLKTISQKLAIPSPAKPAPPAKPAVAPAVTPAPAEPAVNNSNALPELDVSSEPVAPVETDSQVIPQTEFNDIKPGDISDLVPSEDALNPLNDDLNSLANELPDVEQPINDVNQEFNNTIDETQEFIEPLENTLPDNRLSSDAIDQDDGTVIQNPVEEAPQGFEIQEIPNPDTSTTVSDEISDVQNQITEESAPVADQAEEIKESYDESLDEPSAADQLLNSTPGF